MGTPLDPGTEPLSDASALPTERLEAALVAVAAEGHTTRYRMLKLLAAYDARGAWVAWGATSCAVWWAEVADIDPATAREHVRVARSLDELPPLDAAMADGTLSYAKTKVLSRIAEADTVDELVALAASVPAGRLGVVLAAWAGGRLSPEAVAAAHHAARSVSFRTEPDGMVTTIIRQPPARGAALQAAIDGQVLRGDAPAGASLAQLRADAVIRLLGGQACSVVTEVAVHVHRSAEGALLATLEDGTPVPEPELAEVLCEATVRAVVEDGLGRPIDATPHRPAPSRRQRRLLHARDHHCQFRSCRARAFLHAHHVIPRGEGGPTIMANLVLLCSFHHRLVHTADHRWRPGWWSDRLETQVRQAQRARPSPVAQPPGRSAHRASARHGRTNLPALVPATGGASDEPAQGPHRRSTGHWTGAHDGDRPG